ncbi:MAG: hypothetical protein Q8M31_16375 [Beijerinckiaceae bacterium]|nr:hypothetical protein [Beijerinckiaceae bacterium]
MTKKINLDPVLKHIAHRLIEDRQRLSRILDSQGSHDIRDFQEQERLLEHIQASVRALDILEGRADGDGEQRSNSPAAAAVDMEKLADALRPHSAPH